MKDDTPKHMKDVYYKTIILGHTYIRILSSNIYNCLSDQVISDIEIFCLVLPRINKHTFFIDKHLFIKLVFPWYEYLLGCGGFIESGF